MGLFSYNSRQPLPLAQTPLARLSHYRDMARLQPFPTSVPSSKFAEYAFTQKVVPLDVNLEDATTRNYVMAGLNALDWNFSSQRFI